MVLPFSAKYADNIYLFNIIAIRCIMVFGKSALGGSIKNQIEYSSIGSIAYYIFSFNHTQQ